MELLKRYTVRASNNNIGTVINGFKWGNYIYHNRRNLDKYYNNQLHGLWFSVWENKRISCCSVAKHGGCYGAKLAYYDNGNVYCIITCSHGIYKMEYTWLPDMRLVVCNIEKKSREERIW